MQFTRLQQWSSMSQYTYKQLINKWLNDILHKNDYIQDDLPIFETYLN